MTKTYAELMREVRARIREVSTAQAAELVAAGATIVDVRESNEWDEGYLPGAHHVPRGYLESRIEGEVPDRSRPLVVYCAGGVRSALAAETLAAMGYSDVVSMAGGFQAWKSEGRPWSRPIVLSTAQRQRYSRHLLIPEVGSEGQAKLLAAKVLFIGAGGLGAPGLLYLAAAGVGTIGVVDFDVVDVSNLQRQVVHTTDRVGQRKTESAATAIRALNPEVNVVLH